MIPRWLLDVEIDGKAYRWSVDPVSVVQNDGTVLSYAGGLADQALAQGDAAQVSILDPYVNWPKIAPQLDARLCTLRRWTPGTKWEAAEVYSFGEAAEVQFGAPDEPVSWSISTAPGTASLGFQVPDPAAAISYSTWPILAAQTVGQFAPYPVVLGLPGYIAEASTVVAVMPLSIAQWPLVAAAANTWVVIAEDGAAPCTSVTIRNDTLDTQATETVSVVTDLLNRKILAANFTASAVPLPTSSTDRCFAGFGPTGGGGAARTAYDAIVYVLRRWGADSVDWARLPEVRDVLSPFLVDRWYDQPVSDPWAIIEQLVADLPVEIRMGRNGRYLVAKRYSSLAARRVGAIVAGVDAVRSSAVARDGSATNEFSATYRRYITGEWLGRLVLTGSSLVSSPRTLPVPPTSLLQIVTVARDARCQASLARYGLRQAEPIEIDWSWDTGTIGLVLGLKAERYALPAFLVSYTFGPNGEALREGDEVLLTDSELNWSAVPAIVDAPPVRGTTTTALLRVLA